MRTCNLNFLPEDPALLVDSKFVLFDHAKTSNQFATILTSDGGTVHIRRVICGKVQGVGMERGSGKLVLDIGQNDRWVKDELAPVGNRSPIEFHVELVYGLRYVEAVLVKGYKPSPWPITLILEGPEADPQMSQIRIGWLDQYPSWKGFLARLGEKDPFQIIGRGFQFMADEALPEHTNPAVALAKITVLTFNADCFNSIGTTDARLGEFPLETFRLHNGKWRAYLAGTMTNVSGQLKLV